MYNEPKKNPIFGLIQPLCSGPGDGREAQAPRSPGEATPTPPPPPLPARSFCCVLVHFACCCGGIGPGPAGRGLRPGLLHPSAAEKSREGGTRGGVSLPLPAAPVRAGCSVCVRECAPPSSAFFYFLPCGYLFPPSLALRLADSRPCGWGLPALRGGGDGGGLSCASPPPPSPPPPTPFSAPATAGGRCAGC